MSRALLASVFAVVVICCSACGSAPNPASSSSSAPSPATTAAASTSALGQAATSNPGSTPAPIPAETPWTFTSLEYPYSMALPEGWHAGAAIVKWDGVTQPGYDESSVDKFGGPVSASAFAFAGPTTMDLNAFATDRIAATYRDHGDTCKDPLEVKEDTRVGADPAVFLAWNCGILINQVVVIHRGVGFSMVIRDLRVHAATDATDRRLLDTLLAGVTFSN